MISGSECMYHVANCKIDHVTNRAMGKNVMEYWSNLKLSGILKFMINFHSQWEVMLSVFVYMNVYMGSRLVMNAVLVECTIRVGEFFMVVDTRGRIRGIKIIIIVRSIEVLMSKAGSTTFTWICTKVGGS